MPPITVPELSDGVIELRAVTEADVPAFVEAFADAAIAEGAYHGQLAATDAAIRPYLARHPQRMADGDGVLLGVWEPDAQRLSGQTMLFAVDWRNLVAELGFWIAPWARGRGLIGRAIPLTLDLAFGHLGLERVRGVTDRTNTAAQRAMERAGMEREGLMRASRAGPDGRVDQVLYAILRPT